MATGLHTLQRWLVPAATRLVNIAAAAGLSPRVSSARRSHAQQALLYRRFLAGQSRFPAAPPGSSTHELGLAFDLWVNDESQLTDLGHVWEQMGGVWGGHFHDPIHFEAGGATRRAYRPVPQRTPAGNVVPVPGDVYYQLADFLSGFVPGLGQVQLADTIATALGSKPDKASWYLQHPAEAIRDLLS
jgi:hypothetical protein